MEYIDLVNDKYISLIKKNVLYPKFKMELVDKYEKVVLKEIIQDISLESSGNISINYQQGVRMSCNITLINKDNELTPSYENGLFWIGSKFKLYIGLYDIDNDDYYWFSEGVYYVNNPVNNESFSARTVTINGVDKFGVLNGELGYNVLTGTYRVNAGEKIFNVIKSILELDQGNGTQIDYIEPFLDPQFKDEVLPYEINKSVGNYLGDILIELANILGADIFYDKTGRLNVISGTTDFSYSDHSTIWDYYKNEPEYMESNTTFNYNNVVNSVTVIGNNTNDKIYSYTAENNNPLSPTRIDYIGKKEKEPVETPMAYNEQRAKEYAEYLLNRLSILQTGKNFNSILIPHLDVNKVCTISDNYSSKRERFIIQSLSLPLSTKSAMSVTASNIATLPYFDLQVGGN